jgi:N-acetylglucosamine repressor
MNKKIPTNNRFLQKYNEKSILDLIRIRKSISRAELSKVTNLSATAIGTIVAKLIEKGFIVETGSGESSGGRKPVLLELKSNSYFSVGIDIDLDLISIIVLDMTGNIVDKSLTHLKMPRDLNSAMHIIDEKVVETLSECRIPFNKLLGIGISVPGMVNGRTGELLLVPYFKWKNVKIPKSLPSIPKVPVYVENESKASTIYEHWLGCCQGIDNFICINVMTGIGAGIFTNGKLYRGAKGIAGEVGHMQVDESGPLCVCGNYGCLTACASITQIVERVKKLIRQGIITQLNDISNIEDITIDAIIQAARNGDETSKNALLDSSRYLGNAIAMLTNALNPEKVVLGKTFYKYSDLVLDYIRDIVNHRILNIKETKVEVVRSTVGEESSTLGAAIIPLGVFFGKYENILDV